MIIKCPKLKIKKPDKHTYIHVTHTCSRTGVRALTHTHTHTHDGEGLAAPLDNPSNSIFNQEEGWVTVREIGYRRHPSGNRDRRTTTFIYLNM